MQLSSQQVKALLEISVPPSNSRAGWTFDIDAIDKARNKLGIKLPIKFRFNVYSERKNGMIYRGTHYAKEGHHSIILDQLIGIELANEVLWHELAHAHQAELFTELTGKSQTLFYPMAYSPNGRSGSRYRDNPFEVDARRIAKEHKTTWLLKPIVNGIVVTIS